MDWTYKSYNNLPYEKLYSYIKNIVQSEYILVKGQQKKYVLDTILKTDVIIDLDTLGCLDFENLKNYLRLVDKYHCKKHVINSLRCAVQNVRVIYIWYLSNYRIHI